MTNPSPVGLVDLAILAEAVDSLHEGIQVLAPDWRYLYVNEAVAIQGRKPRQELLSKTMPACYPGIEKTRLFATLERCMRDRCAETIENEFTYDDGRRAWFDLRIRHCRAGLVIASVDLTERKLAETKLREAHRQALRDLVNPVIRVHQGVLLVPVVGSLDDTRASQMTDMVLLRVADDCARVVIFDVAGVPTLDTSIAAHLLQTASMLRLLGAAPILSGLAPAAAKAIIRLGVDLSALQTASDLATGIVLALAMVGRRIVEDNHRSRARR